MTSSAVEMLQNRLRKNRRRLSRLLPADTDCYRAYDRDIPEVPVVVERWGPRLRLLEMPGRVVRDDAAHQAFLEDLAGGVAEVFEVPLADVVVRRRTRRRAGEQHGKLDAQGQRHVVKERGIAFWVNLTDYVDCGLFLDHRNARRDVEGLAGGRRVLNLFAYTGAFTVAAARGGAAGTVSVDLSRTYLDWAADNLALNELDGPVHRRVCADVRGWLREAARDGERFDVIVLDPPTVSVSKRMEGDLDVQRDHRELIEGARALLAPGGVLFFSTNLRTFHLDERAFAGARFAEITDRTVPPDFRERIHRCWRMEDPGAPS